MRLLIVIVLMFTILAPTTHLVLAQSADPKIIPGTVDIDAASEEALVKAIRNAYSILPAEVRIFAVTDRSQRGDDFFISIVGMEEYQGSWTLDEDVVWLGLAIVRYSESGVTAAIKGTPDFSSMLLQVPEKYLSAQAKSGLDPLTSAALSNATSPEIPRFPWETYYNMQYGGEGVHSNGFVSGWKAVDFLSDGNTSAGHAPNKLLASLSGSIDYVCRDGRSAAIRIDNFFYTHLMDNANLQVGKSFAQGDYIGQMKPGTFPQDSNYPCGYGYQASGTFHVHWGFPNLSTLEVAGWVLNTTTQVWSNGDQTKNKYDWMYANRTYCTGPTPTAMQLIIYTGLNYCGDYSVLNVGDYPDAISMGLTDNSITSTKLGANVKAIAYGNASYSGISEEINASDFDLRNNTIGNDTISSMKVISLSDTPPAVISITRTGSEFTSASSVEFTVTFSEFVTGVDTNDFTLTTTASISGESIAQIFDSDSIYTILVNTGSGNGTVRLDVTDNNTIHDATGNPLGGVNTGDGDFESGETYTIIKSGSVDVTIDAYSKGQYPITASESQRETYVNTNSGPVQVTGLNLIPILASQRVIFGETSYSEMIGLPKEQLSKEYWFPYYNNVAMDSQLRVSNLGNVSTTINVYLGTQQIDSYTLAGGGATRKNYAGKNGGPLKVTSSDTNILSTIRVLFNGVSYSEMMGLPKEQLSKQYLFPYYNNVAMDSQLRVSNLGNVPTTITVYLGTQQIDSYILAGGSATRKNYSGKNAGPLKVTSSDTNILSTIRVLFNANSYSEMMGLPLEQLAQEYWYPVYDNSALDSQLRVSNVGAGPTTITVYAGNTQIDSYSLNAGAATRKNYAQNTGPLQVVSSDESILSTIRMLYNTPGYSSYYEMMGLPDAALSTQYFFPWYNNVAMNSELRFAVP